MCLAIYKPADTAADWDAYENGFDANKDSWGFAAVLDGTLVTRFGIGNFAEFREMFEPFAHLQAIIHFRWATHGRKDVANCHPFMVADDLAMIHNGIVSIECKLNTAMSDTWHFNELVLKPMHRRDADFYSRPDVRYSQEKAHSGNKFVFLRADGDFAIWSSGGGEWETDGHWYSNSSYEKARWFGFAASPQRDTRPSPIRTGYYEDEAALDDERCVDLWPDAELGEAQPDDVEIDQNEEEEAELDEYSAMRIEELHSFGYSMKTLEEVMALSGHYGIEALHEAI